MSFISESLPVAIVCAVALWFLPGWTVLRAAGVRGLNAWAFAPPLAMLAVAVAGVAFNQVGIAWSRVSALTLWLGALAIVAAIRFGRRSRVRRRRAVRSTFDSSDESSAIVSARSFGGLRHPGTRPGQQTGDRENHASRSADLARGSTLTRLSLVGAAVAGIIVVAALMLGMPDAAAPIQVRDAFVHLNALAEIRGSGNTSMFGGIDAVVAYDGSGSFYPTAWHAMAALLPQASVGLAANAAMIAVMIAVWPVSMVYLTRSIFPARPQLVPIVATLSSALSFFPFTQSVLNAQWANALGTALLPVAIGATVWWLRAPRKIGTWVPLIIGVAGATAAHPNTAFSWLALVSPLLVVVVWRAVSRLRGADDPNRAEDPKQADDQDSSGDQNVSVDLNTAADQDLSAVAATDGAGHPVAGRRMHAIVRQVLPWLTLAGILIVVAAIIRLSPLWPILTSVMNYQQTIGTRSYPFTIGRLLSDTALWLVPGNVIVSLAVIGGAIVLLRRRQNRYVVAAWALSIALAAVAGGPDNALRGITGFWYKHVFRLEALYPITALLLAAVGIWATAAHLAARSQRPTDALAVSVRPAKWAATMTVAALVLMAGCLAPGMVIRAKGVYEPAALAARDALIVDIDDRDMLADIADLIPAGASVIADPASGGVLLASYGDVAAVYQRLTLDSLNADQTLLAHEFAGLAVGNDVCAALANLGVEYAYLDADLQPGGARHDQATEGFADVDVAASGAFEPVATRGSVTLYRITACG